MSTRPSPFVPPGESHTIADHDGVVEVRPLSDGTALQIAYDPTRLSEVDLRRIVEEHVAPDPGPVRRYALRLDGQACEAAAVKLERRVERVPGVRHATATYIGRVLSLTFDADLTNEAAVLRGARDAGARVEPLTARSRGARPSLFARVRSGDLNEELACALGFVCLVAAYGVEHWLAHVPAAMWLYAGAYVLCGQQGVRSALASVRERTLDIDLLMVLAAIGAAIVGAPFEGALLLFLFSFSNVLQRYALDRTQRAIEALLTLRPETALRKHGGTTETVAVETLVPGDIVVIRPGESVPVDGIIAEGSSSIDESSLTGESMPVSRKAGEAVFAGTLNQSGALEVAVTRRSEDSTLARMVKLVAEAQAEKSHTQRYLERAEQFYAMGVIGLTLAVMLVPWMFWGEAFASAFYRAMTIMVVASPCALIISTPATVLSAIGGAARRGILIKGGSHLERAARIDIVAFDKTGTLTVGRPSVTDVVFADAVHPVGATALPVDAAGMLQACAAVESKSEHPLAQAFPTAARKLGLAVTEATDFQSTAGKGAEADVRGTRYVVGSERLFTELGAVGMDRFSARVGLLLAKGRTCVWMGERQGDAVTARAVFALADTLRPEARSIVAALHALGVRKVVMLTGDQTAVARTIAAEAGIDEVLAELLPEDKVQAIRRLKREGRVMMVGDGVNDAPALASADIGVAMGAAGTDIAMETADIVLMGDRLENVALLLDLAQRARRVLLQNLIFASAIIVVLIAGALGFNLKLSLGVIGHEGSTVLVCLNGVRLLAFPGRAAAS